MLGVDLVCISEFSSQLEQPGTVFMRNFTKYELNDAKSSANMHASLAGKWAAKEAFIKAWSSLLIGNPPRVLRDEVNFAEIEVRKDLWGRPLISLHGSVAKTFKQDADINSVEISISHDGDYAIAVCNYNSIQHNS